MTAVSVSVLHAPRSPSLETPDVDEGNLGLGARPSGGVPEHGYRVLTESSTRGARFGETPFSASSLELLSA
jgi:hypothetical protein